MWPKQYGWLWSPVALRRSWVHGTLSHILPKLLRGKRCIRVVFYCIFGFSCIVVRCYCMKDVCPQALCFQLLWRVTLVIRTSNSTLVCQNNLLRPIVTRALTRKKSCCRYMREITLFLTFFVIDIVPQIAIYCRHIKYPFWINRPYVQKSIKFLKITYFCVSN